MWHLIVGDSAALGFGIHLEFYIRLALAGLKAVVQNIQ